MEETRKLRMRQRAEKWREQVDHLLPEYCYRFVRNVPTHESSLASFTPYIPCLDDLCLKVHWTMVNIAIAVVPESSCEESVTREFLALFVISLGQAERAERWRREPQKVLED